MMRMPVMVNTAVGSLDPFGRMDVGLLPALSVYNGPSFLLRAIEVLQQQDIPAVNVRLLPVIAEALCPEIVPYEDEGRRTEWVHALVRQYQDYFTPAGGARKRAAAPSAATTPSFAPEDFASENLMARLGVNVRGDNRLLGLFPLVRLGLVTPQRVGEWEARGLSPRQGYAESVGIFLASYQERGSITDTDPERIAPSALPSERLALQISKMLLLPLDPYSAPLPAPVGFGINESHWQRHFYVGPGTLERFSTRGPHQSAQHLVEIFYTWAMLAVACADNLVGFEYVLPIEPRGRHLPLQITARSTPQDIARWLQYYPHFPRRRDEGKANPSRWNETDYGVTRFHAELGHFYRGETFRAGGETQSVWAHKAQGEAIHRTPQYDSPPLLAPGRSLPPPIAEDKNLPLPTDEILARAARHLPEFLPNYPRQSAITGGLNLEGLLISLMERWRGQGTFLGVSQEQWEALLTPSEQLMLASLLTLRAQIPDQRLLFEEAARLLIHPDVRVWQEEYQPRPIRLGTPMAQLNHTMTLRRNAVLHAPEVILRIPLDETRDEREQEIIAKIDLLQKLFLPVHLPLHPIWNVNRPHLGRTAFLRGPATPTFLGDPAPTARLATDA